MRITNMKTKIFVLLIFSLYFWSTSSYAQANQVDVVTIDGIIDPVDTRMVLGLGISASLSAPIHDWRPGVFRM